MATSSSIALFASDRRPAPRVAVLLNANARAVTPRVIRDMSEVVPRRDLFVSRTLEEAGQIVAEVAGTGYDTVLTGGGDGTFVGFLNALKRYLDTPAYGGDGASALPALAPRPLPRFGVLRLGTGNALASLTGASPLRGAGVFEDVLTARAGRTTGSRRLDLVEVDGLHAPFTGVGYDALIVNNYQRWKNMLGTGALRLLGEGLTGYMLSLFGLSVPEALAHREPARVRVVNLGAPAWRIDLAGRRIAEPVGPGEVLYEGPARIAGAATCPNYGFDLRMFPAATALPGRFQLRVATTGVPEALAHLGPIWRGEYASPTVHDFHAEKVELTFDRPMPFQIGGDPAGWRDRFVVSISDSPVEMVEFGAPRLGGGRPRLAH